MDEVAQVEACRLCANLYVTGAEVDFVHLFEPIGGLEHQLQFLHTQINAWQLNISINDGLPQRICANCLTQFCNIQAFHQQCVLAQQKLLDSFVSVALTVNNTIDADNGVGVTNIKTTHPGDSNHTTQLTNVNQMVDLKIDTPVTNSDSMAPTTSADVIASLDAMQLPASVALSMLTQEYTTMQNGSLLDTSGSAITTHAIMDTKTEETNVLNFTAAPSTQNIYYATQQIPIAAVATEINPIPVTLAVRSVTPVTNGSNNGQKTDIDLEDMLQGSIIQKNTCADVEQPKANVQTKPRKVVYQADIQQSVSSMDDFEDEDMDYNSNSDQGESNLEDEPECEVEIETRISRNPFACQYCFCPHSGSIDHLIFEDSEALSQHFFDVHDPNLPYTCPFCSQKYNSAKQRDYHVRLMHPAAAKADQCDYCKKTLRAPKEVHELNCNFIDDWHCETCDQYFGHIPLSRFRAHQRSHTSRKYYKCGECGRKFVRRANLQAHERMHKPRSDYMIKCDQCQTVFSNDYELRRHKYQNHNGDLPVRCEYCMKGFVSMAFLSRHNQHFHPEKLNGRNYNAATCTNCGCTFSSLHKLRIHIQRPRDENGRCVETIRELAPIQDRSRQTRRPRLHACQHCNKRFSTEATLEKHLTTHEQRTYNCNECVKNFQNTSELKRHIAEAHARPRCLKCDQCDKRFFYMRELQQHVKMHRREIESHLRTMHGSEIAAKETNNNNNDFDHNQILHEQEQDTAVASILNSDLHLNNNNDVIVSFDNHHGMCNGEKVRVELVQQQQPTSQIINQVILQQQEVQTHTIDSFKELIPTTTTTMDMDQNLLMSTLLDAEHEIIVT